MKKKYLYFLIILLFGLNIFLLYHLKETKNIFNKICNSNEYILQSDSIQISNLKKLINYNYLVETKSPDSIVKHLRDNEKLILYITEGNCSPCIEDCLLYFDQIGKSIGEDNILLLGHFRNEKSFEEYAENASAYIKNSQFCMDIGLPEELNKHPVIFTMDSKMRINLLFVPDFFPQYKEEYFKKIIPRYFSMNIIDL